MKTIDEVVYDRGVRHGMKKGREKGMRDSLRSILEVRFKSKVTARTHARLARADSPTLEKWVKRAGTARRSLAAVFS